MRCPNCNHQDTKVIDSRPEREGRAIRRRRECDQCGFRFSTTERIIAGTLVVRKSDGGKELFDREKLEKAIKVASGKRPVSDEQIRDLVRELNEEWVSKHEVTSKAIGEAVMEKLQKLDDIAYIRFASVYKEFKDVAEFQQELGKLEH